MSVHDYAYGVRWDSEGSATAFGTAAAWVRIATEIVPGLSGNPSSFVNAHNSVMPGRAFYASYDFVLEVGLSYGFPEDPDTVYQNLSTVTKRLSHHLEPVWLTRTAPHQGTVEKQVRMLRSAQTGSPRQAVLFPLRSLSFWRDTAVTFSAVNPVSGVTVAGNAPISDGSFVFSGMNGVQRLTHTTSGDWIELDTDTTVNAVTVSRDSVTGELSIVQSGSDVDGVFTASSPWGIELNQGSNAFTLSGSGSCTFTGRDQWL